MKKLMVLTVMMCILFSACGDNDDKVNAIIPGPPTGTEVRYNVVVDAPIITAIKYKKADGTLVDETITVDNQSNWSYTIIAARPFIARVETEYTNTASNTVNGDINIYVDGVLVANKSVSIPPNANLTDALEYLME